MQRWSHPSGLSLMQSCQFISILSPSCILVSFFSLHVWSSYPSLHPSCWYPLSYICYVFGICLSGIASCLWIFNMYTKMILCYLVSDSWVDFSVDSDHSLLTNFSSGRCLFCFWLSIREKVKMSSLGRCLSLNLRVIFLFFFFVYS